MSVLLPATVASGGATLCLLALAGVRRKDRQPVPLAEVWQHRRKVPEHLRRVLAVLLESRDGAGVTARDIWQRSGLDLTDVFRVLHRLEEGGWLTREEQWHNRTFPRYVYRLTEDGFRGGRQLQGLRRRT